MKVEFLPEADEEFREAARYYESEAAGVGVAFIAAVHKAVSEVEIFPLRQLLFALEFAEKFCVILHILFFMPLRRMC